MPLHRRHVAENTKSLFPLDDDHRENQKTNNNYVTTPGQTHSRRSTIFIMVLMALEIAAQVCSLKNTSIRSISHLTFVVISTFVSTLPVLFTLAVGLGMSRNSKNDLPHQRYIPLAVASTIFASQLPTFLSYGMATAGIAIFGLSSRPIEEDTATKSTDGAGRKDAESQPKGKKISGQLKAVFAVFVLIAVLLTENFFIWVVSASYKPSQDIKTLPSPLQDNGQIALKYIFHDLLYLNKRNLVTLRNMINVEAILVSGLGLSLVAIEVQGASMKRSLWAMAMRGVLTLAAARSIRTISFLITVVPSQNPMCYFSHFPPPPDDWYSWLKVGLIPQVDGGCNDLIISGHATVTSTLACVVTSVVGKSMFTTAIWMFVSMDYFVEIYEGFHYSVDMFLGVMLVNFLWSVLSFLEDPREGSHEATQKRFRNVQDSTSPDVVKYLLPALGSWIQLVGIIPHSYGNYSCVFYTVLVVFQIARFGFQQYSQHCLFCLLFMALGLFL
eukprot:CAMPEP_0197176888 /NCGR_PEP_ID=MMETSP1423-20130617/2668_1 /TAXON_ID=476441 /ORGANISM="Pseudo-nitzschia heimii, Strain UNC1101" /LENGTH=498 /DNA_ID=CAMNT_0042626331 /DNA_START=70 /DNA_END=1566 /DNA_ORIENTATION=-